MNAPGMSVRNRAKCSITIFVDEPTAIIQNVSSGFYPIGTTRACMITLRKEPLPEFPDRSVIQNGSCGSSTERNRGPNMIEPSPETSRTKPVQLLREEERGCPTWAILCARAARVILNHAPIGEYRARFHPQEPIACPCER